MAACHVTVSHRWCRHSQSCLSLLFGGGGWFCFINVLNVFKFTAHRASSRHTLSWVQASAVQSPATLLCTLAGALGLV